MFIKGYNKKIEIYKHKNYISKAHGFWKWTEIKLNKDFVETHHDTLNPLSANPTKMVKNTQTIRRKIADELFECVWPFSGANT